MTKLLTSAVVMMALATPASANIYHYVCKNGDTTYALTVNTDKGVVKLMQRAPTKMTATFKILKVSNDINICAKYGWILNDGATFCTATQGVGTLDWNGQEFECDQADID